MLKWNRIAREVAISQQLDTWENARLFALVNLAMADGFIGGFEAKYYYNYWRPATAIREAGNKAWINYLPTPPVYAPHAAPIPASSVGSFH